MEHVKRGDNLDVSAEDWNRIVDVVNRVHSGPNSFHDSTGVHDRNDSGGGPGTTTIIYQVGNGQDEISAGNEAWIPDFPFDADIVRWTIIADVIGSIVIDVWVASYDDSHPTNADSITADTPPEIASTQKSQNTALTDWIVGIPVGSTVKFHVDSAEDVKFVVLALRVEPS